MDEWTREGFIEDRIACKSESTPSFPKEIFAVVEKGKNHDKRRSNKKTAKAESGVS